MARPSPGAAPARSRPPHRDAVGALAVWAFGLQGLLLSALLTVLKFRADTLCDEDSFGACPLGQVTACAAVLGDSWSAVLGVPLTVHSAAYFAVVAGLALVTVLGRAHRRWTRPVLLVLAWAGLCAALALAVRATVVLGALCPYCLFLYGAVLGVWVGARLMNPWGLRGALLRARGAPRTWVVAGLAALAFLTAVSVQRTWLSRSARASAGDLSPCEVRLGEVPVSPLTLTSADPPRLIAAVFLDLACPHCRGEFESWPAYQAAAPWPIELRYYHFPVTGCSREDLAAGAADLSRQRSCDAARALHCMMEQGDPARRFDMMRALFAAQDRPAPHFSAEHLAAVARDFGIAADPARAAADDPLFRCMTAAETTAALVRDVEFAEQVADLDRPPGALLIPLRDGRPFGRAQQVRGRKPRAAIEGWIADLLADPPEPG